MRGFRSALWVVALAATLAAVWFLLLGREGMRDTVGQGDYVLAATDGSTFSAAALKGRPSGVFFGFTHCPDVCPTTLGEIGDWFEALGPEANDLRFWFVTVDPERDSLDQLRDYVSWTPGVVGAAGSLAEVTKAMEAFKIYARKVPLSDGSYTMDHTPYVMLFGRDGRLSDVIPYQEDPAIALSKLRKLLAG